MDQIIFETFDDSPPVMSGEIAATIPMNAGMSSFASWLGATIPMYAGMDGGQYGASAPSVSVLYAHIQMTAGMEAANSATLGATIPMNAGMSSFASWLGATIPMFAGMMQFPPVDPEAAWMDVRYITEPYASIAVGWIVVEVEESLLVSASLAAQWQLELVERLSLGHDIKSVMQATLALEDAVAVGDALRIIRQVLVEERLNVADTASLTRTVVMQATDRLVLSGMVASALEAHVAIASALVLNDAVSVSWLADLQEALGVEGSVEVRIEALVNAIEQLELTDAVNMSLSLLAKVDETLTATDSTTMQLDALVVLDEALECFGTVVVNGDVYSCWLINTESKGVARYTNYPFNSFAKAPWGQYVGATDTGLHVLDGDDDDGAAINAVIRSGLTDFGSRHLKRVPSMYLGYTASGPLVLKVIHTSEQGQKVEDWYQVEPRDANAVRESRFKVGRGIASVYLGFELVNVDGADFALDVVQWEPLRLDRRVR